MYTDIFKDEDIDESTAQKLGDAAAEQVVSNLSVMLIGGVVSIGLSLLTSLIVTNYHEETVTGDKKVSPTDDETTLESRKTSGAEQDSKLAQEEFNGQEGKVDGTDTKANAVAADTNASSADVNASKTQAGAIDTGAQGMKIN